MSPEDPAARAWSEAMARTLAALVDRLETGSGRERAQAALLEPLTGRRAPVGDADVAAAVDAMREASLARLAEAAALAPGDPLVAALHALACRTPDDACLAAARAWSDADAGNAAAWLHRASIESSAGRDAAPYLERALAADRYSGYFDEVARFTEDALRGARLPRDPAGEAALRRLLRWGAGDWTEEELRANYARFGSLLLMPVDPQALTAGCDRGRVPPATCYAIALRIADGGTLADRALGLSLARRNASAVGPAAVARTRAASSQLLWVRQHMHLLRGRAHFAAWRAHGEWRAALAALRMNGIPTTPPAGWSAEPGPRGPAGGGR